MCFIHPEENSSKFASCLMTTMKAEYIELPCFSMRDPYASLLLHGVKTVETRNWPMLKDVSGWQLGGETDHG